MTIENKSLKFPTILITLMVFFGHLIPVLNYYYMQVIIIIFITILLKNTGKLNIRNNVIWFLCFGVVMISLIYSSDVSSTIRFAFMFILALLAKAAYEGTTGWQLYFEKCFFFGSLIHVLCTLLQFISPNIITSINSFILTNDSYLSNVALLERGAYAGITGQTGINSFFISVFIAIVFSRLISASNKKVVLSILLALGLIALLITVKRSQIIINIVCMAILFLMFINSKSKNKLYYFFIPLLLGGIGYVILNSIPETKAVFEKFIVLFDSSDFTNGRQHLWESTLIVFSDNLFIGIGAGAIETYVHEMTHNIYIQLLGELGLVGFTLFVTAFIITIYTTIKSSIRLLKNNVDEKEKGILALSIYLQFHFLFYGFSGNPLYGTVFLVTYMQMIAMVNTIGKKNL